MPKSQDTRQPTPSTPISARVVRISPIGLIVKTDDGQEGLIREREIAWKVEDREGWRTRFRIGQQLRVVPLKMNTDHAPEMSLRLVDFDPWQTVPERYPVGMLVDGVVTDVVPYGAFVELEQGVTGLLHDSNIPSWEKRETAQIFWPRDKVKVVVDAVNPTRRRMQLSVSEISGHRWRNREIATPYLTAPSEVATSATSQMSLLQDVLAQSPKRVLVVEDDAGQRRSVVEWLQHVNQIVEPAASGEEALEKLTTYWPDLVLMDVGLPGMQGTEAARKILTSRFPCRCIMMTDWGRAEANADELNALVEAGATLMLKPLLPEDLLNALLSTTPGIVLSATKQQVRSRIEQITAVPQQVTREVLLGYLAQLRNSIGADKVVLFELEPDGQRLSVYAHQGPVGLHLEAVPKVIHSPVFDVVESQRSFLLRGTGDHNKTRAQYLYSLLDFRVCLGVPTPASLQNRYALFMFSISETVNPEAWLPQATITAAQVGLWLERQQFVQQAANLLRSAMMGQLARGMVHEISGRLNPLNLATERLLAGCDALEKAANSDPGRVIIEVQHARADLENLRQQTAAFTKTARSFSRMARSGQEEIIVVRDIVDEAVEVLRDLAVGNQIEVVVQPTPRVYLTRAQVNFLQQALVNVIQNAIQQISHFRPKQPGRIELWLTQQVTSADKPALQVKIEDDGPGIHRRLWERIFEADYTTRPEGTGLGLYISKSLVESQGGRLYVEDSHIHWGSTFVIELPVRL